MPLINCEVINNSTGEGKFKITDAKLYVSIVTLSTQDNAKLLEQLKSSFKRTINWRRYQSEPKTYARNRHLNHLINSSFQKVIRLFVLFFENEDDRKSHSTYYLPKVEIKDYNVMIDGKNLCNQPILKHMKTLEKLLKVRLMITELVVSRLFML